MNISASRMFSASRMLGISWSFQPFLCSQVYALLTLSVHCVSQVSNLSCLTHEFCPSYLFLLSNNIVLGFRADIMSMVMMQSNLSYDTFIPFIKVDLAEP